tara:strand:+ start:769 stop:1254 length:486 start_codon:yes stop_codon:yes gene_type:complete
MYKTIVNLAYLYLITALPFLELRASIPYGILALQINWLLVFIICIISNILITPLIWFFVEHVMHFFLKIKWIETIYKKIVVRTQKRVHPYVEKYGTLGLAIFIGIPLPGSGVYSGCLGAYLLGYKFKDYLIASVLGVLIAGIIVTIVTLTGTELFSIFIKT